MSTSEKKLISSTILDLSNVTKDALLSYFNNTWTITESLFSSLANDSVFYEVPDKLRHPLVFYLCHPATFYVNKFREVDLISESERINPYFERIFAVGVDEMSWDDYSREPMDWPMISEVKDYRKKCYDLIYQKIQSWDIPSVINWTSPFWILVMCFDHERIHIETSSVLFRQLPVDHLSKPSNWPDYAPIDNDQVIENEWIDVPSSVVEMGKPYDFPTYGWDNEYGKRVVAVSAFRAKKFLTTNKEFLEFVLDGGYTNNLWWSDEGWRWRCFINCTHPLFWVPTEDGNSFKYRTVWDVIEMPWNWPVDVNYLEAQAFCRWKGEHYRLITEAEWNITRGEIPANVKGTKNEELLLDNSIPGNTNMRFGSSSAVNKFPPSSNGFYDVFGNVWQWTEDHNDGLAGFRKHKAYLDFSDPCFDGLHNVIQGGSWISTGCQASVFGRFAFRRHFYQHCGFRIAQTKIPVDKELYGIAQNPHKITVNHWKRLDNFYEQDETYNSYMLNSYGEYKNKYIPEILLENFAQRIVGVCRDQLRNHSRKTALDLGCGVGRTTFELARFCDSVRGIELSEKFYYTCQQLKNRGEVPYHWNLEGKMLSKEKAIISPEIDRSKVIFERADASNLRADIGSYDLVLLSNVIDRLADPKKCVDRLASLINVNGIVVITSPLSWSEEFTHPSKWFGGYMKGEEKVKSFDGLKKMMELNNFTLLEERELPFVFPHHSRRMELCISHCSVWEQNESSQS